MIHPCLPKEGQAAASLLTSSKAPDLQLMLPAGVEVAVPLALQRLPAGAGTLGRERGSLCSGGGAAAEQPALGSGGEGSGFQQ